ncbi:MAG: hypothetical protein HFE75_09825 [Firmicutes bacterium]|jgi:hypothetical protein|nr:hypothetical protein [Bacillota bacterium]
MDKLPLKLRVFEYLSQADHPVTTQEVMDAIKDEYAGERQMNYHRMDDYMQALLGVNMIREANVEYNEKGELQVHYEVTDFGKSRIKYIPKKHWGIRAGAVKAPPLLRKTKVRKGG